MGPNRRLLAVLTLVAALAALVLSTPAAASNESTTKCTAFAVLKAGNEVPPTTSRASGAAVVHINGTTLSFAVAIFNPAGESFVAGHIHVGAAGVNGPVVVPLFAGSVSTRLIFQADRLTITEERAAAICGNPSGFYVNYHTTEFPGGAIRGQLNG